MAVYCFMLGAFSNKRNETTQDYQRVCPRRSGTVSANQHLKHRLVSASFDLFNDIPSLHAGCRISETSSQDISPPTPLPIIITDHIVSSLLATRLFPHAPSQIDCLRLQGPSNKPWQPCTSKKNLPATPKSGHLPHRQASQTRLVAGPRPHPPIRISMHIEKGRPGHPLR